MFREIEYVLNRLAKQSNGASQIAAVKAIISSDGLLELRDALCRIIANMHKNAELVSRRKKLMNARSIFSSRTSTLTALQLKKDQQSIFKPP